MTTCKLDAFSLLACHVRHSRQRPPLFFKGCYLSGCWGGGVGCIYSGFVRYFSVVLILEV